MDAGKFLHLKELSVKTKFDLNRYNIHKYYLAEFQTLSFSLKYCFKYKTAKEICSYLITFLYTRVREGVGGFARTENISIFNKQNLQ